MREEGFVTWDAFKAHRDKDWRVVHAIVPNIRGVVPIPRGGVGAHTHLKVDITDTPWAWGDVLKTGSNLTDLVTRLHSSLQNIGANDHHAQSHTLASHSTKPHSALTDVLENQHHNKVHALTGTHHNASGLTVGWVIKATGATTFAWGQLPHDKLAGLGDDDHAHYLLASGARALTGNWDAGGYQIRALKFYSDQATGTPPFTVLSTTKVNNLNVDRLDNYHIADLYLRTQLQTSGQAEVHWGNITNEPTYYPPEFHYHVGKEIVSLHLVDLDDVEADDIFDVLPTAAIHGEGNYDWFGTWDTDVDANCSAEIVVLAGDDKYLRLTDNNVLGLARTELTCDPGHEMVTGVVEFSMRCSIDTELCCHLNLAKGGTANMGIRVKNIPPAGIYFYNGTGTTLLVAFTVDTWYKIRIHFDCVARAAVIFVDNVFKLRIALNAGAVCDFVDSIRIETDAFAGSNYTFDINNLKIFNLTI